MDKHEHFLTLVKQEMTAILATSGPDSVSMRTVSPVCYQNAVLIFTDAGSKKYQQLQVNPHCSLSVGNYFAEATVKFCGATMREENAQLREAYRTKFPDAFDENVDFGGRNAEFILIYPTRLSGWDFADDVPKENAIPTVPFDISL